MRRMLLLTLCVLFLFAAYGCTGSNRDDGTPPEMDGLIFEMEDGRILVVKGIEDAGIPYDEWYEAGNRAAWFDVSDKTEIRMNGKKVSPEELAIGQKVQVWAVGHMMESYPEQGEARKIVILED